VKPNYHWLLQQKPKWAQLKRNRLSDHSMQMSVWFFVAIGGAVGACLRFAISELMLLVVDRSFPYATLLVNIIGSFVMGFLIASFESNILDSETWRHIISIGFLGALTTFSTFSIDTLFFLQNGEWLKAGLNIICNVIFSIFAAWLGYCLVTKGLK
jgi:CrcB protein